MVRDSLSRHDLAMSIGDTTSLNIDLLCKKHGARPLDFEGRAQSVNLLEISLCVLVQGSEVQQAVEDVAEQGKHSV